jgi:hypothetical protein
VCQATFLSSRSAELTPFRPVTCSARTVRTLDWHSEAINHTTVACSLRTDSEAKRRYPVLPSHFRVQKCASKCSMFASVDSRRGKS